jgi:hypothetical protein
MHRGQDANHDFIGNNYIYSGGSAAFIIDL